MSDTSPEDRLERLRRRRGESLPTVDGPARASAYVCEAVSCLSARSDDILVGLGERVAYAGFTDVAVKRVGCLGLCAAGPLVQIPETGQLFTHVRPDDLGGIVEALTTVTPGAERVPEAPFFSRQVRIATENSGRIDPERLEDYVDSGGYRGAPLRPDLDDAGRGARRDHPQRPARPRWRRLPDRPQVDHRRQGRRARPSTSSATPTKATPARSWTAACSRATRTGSSRAWRSRHMRSAPAQGYIYCRAEYPLAVSRLRKAIRASARAADYLGPSILDTEFGFDVEMRVGAGAFVCGEETALIASIEGGRGTPTPATALSRGLGSLASADAHQQRRDVRQHRPDHPQRRRLVRRHRDRDQQGHEGLRARRPGREHRTDRGADGHDPARDRVRHRRWDRRRCAPSRPCRPAVRRAAASRPSTSTCPSTTSRSSRSARSWARAA